MDYFLFLMMSYVLSIQEVILQRNTSQTRTLAQQYLDENFDKNIPQQRLLNVICENQCHRDCSYRGLKVNGQCQCNQGYTDISCNRKFKDYYQYYCGNLAYGSCCKGITCTDKGICTGSYAQNGCCLNQCSGKGGCNSSNRCDCEIYWTGPDCAVKEIDYEQSCLAYVPGYCCKGINCFNGVCSQTKNNTCLCQYGYTGFQCNIGCPNNCSNVGRCVDNRCICETPWTGENCSVPKPSCLNACFGRGICDNGICQCLQGWGRSDCSVLINEVISKCQGMVLDNLCICKRCYHGTYCEYKDLGCVIPPNNFQNGKVVGSVVGVCVGIYFLFVFFIWLCCQNYGNQPIRYPSINQIRRATYINRQSFPRRLYPRPPPEPLPPQPEPLPILFQSQSLPTIKIQSTRRQRLKQQSQQNSDQICCICLDNIFRSQQMQINCPSKHLFHEKCINQWLVIHGTCPQCRAVIPK